jgi:hypothetical protein
LLSEVLLNHVVPLKRVRMADVPAKGIALRLKAVSGSHLTLRRTRDGRGQDMLRVDDIKVLTADLKVGMGVVHLVEHALIPTSVRSTHTTLQLPLLNIPAPQSLPGLPSLETLWPTTLAAASVGRKLRWKPFLLLCTKQPSAACPQLRNGSACLVFYREMRIVPR